MRDILFRGKRKDSDVWEYGFLKASPNTGRTYISVCEKDKHGDNWLVYEVYQKSVGQFTGLLDCNKARIFEGDIVLYKDMKLVVRWDNDKAGFFVGKDRYWMMNDINLEVIGNVTDNKELLEVKE